ncbi:MAG: hypothetical protein ACRDUS_19340 [Mycobacterium sp.]
MNAPMYSDPARKLRDKKTLTQAIRYSLAVLALAAIAFVTTVAWIGRCSVSLDADTAACGRDGVPVVTLVAPLILLAGGIIAFVQTYRVWKRRESWWIWQGAGWFLLLLMVAILILAQPKMT